MIEVRDRRTVVSALKGYCYLSDDNATMEVTEWITGEGYDVHVERKDGSEKFSLTHGEFELLQVLINWRGE